ncbi:PREDICTED: purple acid phosphatase 22-like [Nelumbo nucifera]|uniref:Purple acid phosphatase n=2 Tax=Nelumbo nucifera TaxID=4432 RepID=A0A1U8AYA4_NELNU|nr:PREDICTED: purple acid phosphatase 22-like [Nelumbo nucifera]DAD28799.1 TPA_asm: hypothetical protein HUJ06_030267 [Nelumbo nucifera]
MEKAWSYVFSSLLIFFFLQFIQLQASSSMYTRPPPRSIIFTPHNRSDSEPQQVHISLVGRDHMRISWITQKHAPSIVEYGKTPGKYDASVTGDHTSYHYFFYLSGKIHQATIGPLDPDTNYYYRCSGTGEEFTLKTPPTTFPIEFVVAGDLGQTEWTESTLAHIGSRNYDVLLLPGDLSYADTQQPLWDTFGRFVEPYASSRPWMVTEGNHEIEVVPIIHSQAFTAYNTRWRMPFEESGSKSNLYYSFDVAGVHVVMLGSYTDFDAGSEQYKWLQSDLAKVDRSVTPWIVVCLHAPWYNTNIAHQGEGENMRKAMEELLYQARVDTVLAGHVHAYERFTRVYNNKAEQCGPVHVTIGDGGNREGLALTFKKPNSPLSLFREASFGHGRLTVYNRTHAHWSWHRNDDTDSTVGDEVWLESLAGSSRCGVSVHSRSDDDEL